jgi:hypothetical protein
VYKSVAVLKRQCANKKKKRKIKRKRRRKRTKFGTSLVTDNNNNINLSRIQYIIVGKEKPEEGAMSMYDDDDNDETIYGYGSFDRSFTKNKGRMLNETSFGGLNNIQNIYSGELIPIYNERPHFLTPTVLFNYSDKQEYYRDLQENEIQNFNWHVFNPFNTQALKKEEEKINLHDGIRRDIQRMKKTRRDGSPKKQKPKAQQQQQQQQQQPVVEVEDEEELDEEDGYSDIEFGRRRRKRKKTKRKRKKAKRKFGRQVAKRSNEKLWRRIQQKYYKSNKGGKPGQWSARKAQLAVQQLV